MRVSRRASSAVLTSREQNLQTSAPSGICSLQNFQSFTGCGLGCVNKASRYFASSWASPAAMIFLHYRHHCATNVLKRDLRTSRGGRRGPAKVWISALVHTSIRLRHCPRARQLSSRRPAYQSGRRQQLRLSDCVFIASQAADLSLTATLERWVASVSARLVRWLRVCNGAGKQERNDAGIAPVVRKPVGELVATLHCEQIDFDHRRLCFFRWSGRIGDHGIHASKQRRPVQLRRDCRAAPNIARPARFWRRVAEVTFAAP